MSCVLLIAVLLCVLLVLAVRLPAPSWCISLRCQRHAGPDDRKYPHLDPFLGLDLIVQTWREYRRGELSEGLRRRHLLYGRTFSTTNLGSDCIYTVEPENIRAVTTLGFDKFGKAAWAAEAAKYVGDGVLMNEGKAWKHSRAMLKPIFSQSALDEPTLLEPHVRSLVRRMRLLSAEGHGVFDFHELASMFTLDLVTEFLFGRSTDCLGNPEGADGQDGLHFLSLVKDFEGPSGKFIALGPLAWLELLPQYRRLIGLVEGMRAFFKRKLNDIIAETDARGDGRGTPRPAEQSTSVFRSMKAAGLSEGRMQGELQNIFFASYDTTSTFLANLMHVLVRHAGVQQRLRSEIAFLEGHPPSRKDLGRMRYMRLVIMEALRLYSPVSSHSRTARVDTTLPRGAGPDGRSPLHVRAGATVVWSTYSLNRDAGVYGEDWAEFRPERWTTLMEPKGTITTTTTTSRTVPQHGDVTGGRGGGDGRGGGTADDTKIGEEGNWRTAFMPFGSGPRSCLGQQMVQVEAAYVLVRLLQAFPALAEDDVDVGKPFREAKAVSFYNEEGVHIRVG